MPSRTEGWVRRLIGRTLLAMLLALVAIPVYLSVDPTWRPAAVRLACTLVVVAGCVRARRAVRRVIGQHALSALDAPPPPPPMPELDLRFLRIRDDVVSGIRSRRYFDQVLWPRLLDAAGGSLVPPPERRWIRRRGPSPGALAKLVDQIERRA